MLSHRCAFCGNQTHFTARTGWINTRAYEGAYYYDISVAATCDSCRAFNVANGVSPKSNMQYEEDMAVPSVELLRWANAMTDVSWSPPSMIKADVEFLPDNVGGFLQEAHDAHSVGAHRAVLLLVRSVIEATAKDKGILDGSLVQKINELSNRGEIRVGTKEMAHALRVLGNDMAHGDIGEVPTEEDASDALKIVKFVLDDVYVADAVRADMMKRRGKE